MTIEHDRHGFLVGRPVDDAGKTDELLEDIKANTSKIAASLSDAGETDRRTRPGPYTTGPHSRSPRASAAAVREVVTPAGRAGRPMARAASGTGATAASTLAQNRRLAEMSAATRALVRVNEAQRRDAKAAKRGGPAKGASGSAPAQGGKAGGLLRKSGQAVADAAHASQQVDPLLASAGEAASMIKRLSAVAVPIGRAAGSLTGWASKMRKVPPGVKPDRNGRLRDAQGRYLKDGELARMRAAQARRAPQMAAPGPTDSGGGFWSSVGAGAGGAAGLGIARWLGGKAASLIGGGVSALGKSALKRLPLVGGLIGAVTALIDDQRIANDSGLTDKERGDMRVENLLGGIGELGGGSLGAAIGMGIGTAILPVVGTAIGGVVGGLVGGWAGKGAGTKVADAVNSGDGGKWAGVRDLIVGASKSAGVDPGLLAQISTFESGNNPNARPIGRGGVPMSSAHGLGQLLDGTWADTVRKHGEKYGITGAGQMTDAQTMAYRSDAAMQANMLAELTAENVKLGRGLGGAEDAANVYALHNLGAAGGSKFLKALKANPGASVADVLSPTEIANNRSLYQTGMGRTATMGEAYANMSAAMAAGDSNAADARALAGRMPSITPPSIMTAPGPVPTIDTSGVTRLNSPAPAPAPAPYAPPAGQDVSDRGIAHITSGGIGRLTHRW